LCSSFSKTLAPGYRVGWIAPGRLYADVLRLKSVNSSATATPTQLAIASFLADGGYDRHLRKIRKAYARNAVLLAEAVSAHFPEGTRVTRPQGGQVLWVELPKRIDSLALYEKARRANISIAPGPIFSSQRKYRNFIRLNSAMWSDKIRDAVALLGKFAGKE
jgi:DNA-binding transcriptional MocR family regulator